MRTLAVVALLGALASVAAIVMLQTRASDRPPVEHSPPTDSIPQSRAPVEQVPPVPSRQSEPANALVGGAVPPMSQPLADGAAERFFRIVGPRLAAYLQQSGLSKADSDRIVAAAFTQFAECGSQALREEAESRGVPPEALTKTLAAAQRNRNAVPSDLVAALNAKSITCQTNAAQQAGIPMSVVEEAVLDFSATAQ